MDERPARLPDPTEPVVVPPRPAPPIAAITEPIGHAEPPVTEPIGHAEPVAAAEPEATTLPLPVIPQAAASVPPAPPAGAPSAAKPPRTRRRGRGLIVTAAVVVVLGVLAGVGWVAGNSWAKGLVVADVARQTRAALGLAANAPVQVGVADPVLPQLVAGTLTSLTVTVPDAPIGGATGTVTLHATKVPIRGGGTAGAAAATVKLAPEAITKLVGDLGRTVPGSLHIAGGDIAVSLDPSQFLSGVSFILTLRPGVSGGQLVLTPVGFQVGGGQLSADLIRQRFGTLADGILAPRRFCVADRFPRGMTLTGITVQPDAVTPAFTVDPRMLTDAALRRPGTCG